jgi:glycosyltransferase involved in cell wall biosynthesis/GNAT superfamily N-acetyltransferase
VEYPNFRPSPVAREDIEDGAKVVRLPSFAAPRSRLVTRAWESWSFGRQVCRYLENQAGDVDVVYANTWPLLSQALIARHCARRGIPLVLHIKDIYPESLLGRIPGWSRGLVGVALTAFDRWIVRRAACVVVISENMRRTYVENRGFPPEKVLTIMDWVDERRFATLPARAAACARYGIPEDPFTFLFLGNIGPVAGVEGLIEAFHAAGLKQAQLVIAGDGSSKAACVQLAQRLGASAVRFVSDPDAGHVPLLQSLGHVCLLPLRKGAGLSSIPSKLIAYLLSAKPVLATLDAGSDSARFLHEAQCGWVGEPENFEWLAAKMAQIAALPPPVLETMGQRGRTYGLEHFSMSEGLRSLRGVILGAVRQSLNHNQAGELSNCHPAGLPAICTPLRKEEAEQVAALHMKELSSNFQGKAGRKLLACYYRAVSKNCGASCYTWNAESLKGFVCGIWDADKLRGTLLRTQWLGMMFWSVVYLLVNPPGFRKCFARFHFDKDFAKNFVPIRRANSYELRPIVTSVDSRGRGVAQALLQTLLEDARSRGFSFVSLHTEVENGRANAFYRKSGFLLEARIRDDNYYVIRCNKEEGHGRAPLRPENPVVAGEVTLNLQRIKQRIREVGWRGAAGILLLHAESIFFDWRNGTASKGRVSLSELDIPFQSKAHGTKHDPSPVFPLRKVLRQMPIRGDDVFVDLGSGKGRSLLVAAGFPFRRVVGVEFSEELCRIAGENLRRYSAKNPGVPPFEIRNADAAEVCVEADWSVFYLFNPFDAVVLHQVLCNVERSYRANPRKIRLLYNHPVCREVVESYGFLQLQQAFHILGREILFYQTAGGD